MQRATSAIACAALTIETTTAEAADVAAQIEAVWMRPVVIVERPESDRAWIDVYFDRDVEALLAAIAARRWKGVRAAQPRVLKKRSWQSFWKDHFRIQDIGSRIRIQPVWKRHVRAPRDRVRILLDPGLSFGTGEHFTTRFCLEQLDRIQSVHPAKSMLDVGTGSGILALAAAKLGIPLVLAVDNDPQAIEHARANARLNRLGSRIRFEVCDLESERWPRARFDVVCANLYSRLLTTHAERLAGSAKRLLVLSGLREEEMDAVADPYLRRGMQEIVRDGNGEWGGIVFSWTRFFSI